MRRRLARLAGVLCGLCLVMGCTGGAVAPVGHGGLFGPQVQDGAPVWPGAPGVEFGDQSSRWWPVASARDLRPTGIDVVASSGGIEEVVVDGGGVVWMDVPWGLVRLDPGTWSTTVWDASDDAAFVSKGSVRASRSSGVWLLGADRVRLFDGIRFVRDIQVPSAYLGEGEEGLLDLVEVGSAFWVASETGVARCDGRTWSMVGERPLNDVESLQLTPWGEVWAGSWTRGLFRWTRYDGTSWTPIDRPDYAAVDAIAWDSTEGIVATSRPEILRYNGSDWRSLLRLDDDDGEDVWVEDVAVSGDGTVWAIVGESAQLSLLRLAVDGEWHLITSPDGTSPTGLAVSGRRGRGQRRHGPLPRLRGRVRVGVVIGRTGIDRPQHCRCRRCVGRRGVDCDGGLA